MKKAHVLNKFRKDRSNENCNAYKKQQKFSVKLLKAAKKIFCKNLGAKVITDDIFFWKTRKPNFII